LAGADDHPLEQRFLASGIDTCHPGQKATVLTPQFRARILTATRKMPNVLRIGVAAVWQRLCALAKMRSIGCGRKPVSTRTA